jgi:hypothetical protein
VYSYAFGQLVSRALYERVKKDPKFINKVDEFLCAGGSNSPEEIFAKCGLNLYKPGVFLEGLKGTSSRSRGRAASSTAKRRGRNFPASNCAAPSAALLRLWRFVHRWGLSNMPPQPDATTTQETGRRLRRLFFAKKVLYSKAQ